MVFILSLGVKPCGSVVDALLSIGVNVGRLDGDPLVLEILRENLYCWSARNNCLIAAGSGCAGVITGRPGSNMLYALKPLPTGL